MKLRIGGTDYTAVSHQTASPLHLMELQQQSKRLVDGGLGMSRIEQIMRDTSGYAKARREWLKSTEAGQDAGQEPIVPDDGLVSMAITIFLARRSAGEKLTFEEAIDVTGVEWIPEPGDNAYRGEEDEDDEPDPTVPGPASPVTPDVAVGEDVAEVLAE